MTVNILNYDGYDIMLNNENGKMVAFYSKNIRNNMLNKYNVTENDICKLYINEAEEQICNFYRQVKSDNVIMENNNDLQLVIFNTSNRCNLQCKYCYTSAEPNSPMITSELIIKTITKIFEINNCKNLQVLFQGGEPLLSIQEIITAVSYFNKKPVVFSIQTNGTLLTKEIIKKLDELNVNISISLDGLSTKFNSLRDTSGINICDTVKKSIDIMLAYDIPFGLITVVTNSNIDYIDKIVDEYINYGIKSFKLNVFQPLGRGKDMCNEIISNVALIDKMKIVFSKMINLHNISQNFSLLFEENLALIWQRIFYRKLNNYMCSKMPCGAGKNVITVNFDGNVYPCTYFLPNVILEDYKIANIMDDSFKDILIKPYDNMLYSLKFDKCKTCSLRSFCGGGGCNGSLFNIDGENAHSYYCEYYFEIIQYIIVETMRVYNKLSIKNF